MFDLFCKKCGKNHDGSFGSGKYCSRSCANSRQSQKTIKIAKCIKCGSEKEFNKHATVLKYICNNCSTNKKNNCKLCGDIKKECLRPDICNSSSVKQLMRSLIKYFGFDKNKLGTIEFYKEFERIKQIFLDDYINKEMSTIELQKKYNCLNQRISKILNLFTNGKLRGCSEAVKLAIKNEKLIPKGGYTKPFEYITWDNKKVFLRSSYEKHYATQLDEQKIEYEVEKIKLLYWDSQLQRERVAIVDFFIKKDNLLIEIKSNYTLDIQNMKDRVKSYKEHGYNFKLILDKKEVDL